MRKTQKRLDNLHREVSTAKILAPCSTVKYTCHEKSWVYGILLMKLI